ncbi:hypothetical protein [Devosia naphthalenivorans]|uniref:hypothetical protein n=1 Tax=Devosia naphthalenivorans TaxID=2082392 RepID=UPI001FE84840|nr:hypothetical protein [Devosia naphthalenivorans]
MRLERVPHSGQSPSGSAARARTTIFVSVSIVLSTTSPAGIKDEIRIFIACCFLFENSTTSPVNIIESDGVERPSETTAKVHIMGAQTATL